MIFAVLFSFVSYTLLLSEAYQIFHDIFRKETHGNIFIIYTITQVFSSLGNNFFG
jgi:hypothetical protein